MKITGLDYPCMDMGIFCDRLPEDGGWQEMRQATLMGGGKIPNALVAAARLGAEAALIGTVGSDRYGRAAREDLAMNGVGTDALLERPGTTALCLCISDREAGGKRAIESLATYRRLMPEELDAGWLASSDLFLVYELDETAVRAVQMARAAGARVLADGDGYDERTEAALPLIDIFIMSEYYFRAKFGDFEDLEARLKAVCGQGPRTAIVTLGGAGLAGYDRAESFFRLPAFSGHAIVDSTGAGDVFHGAYACFAAAGLGVREAARRASAVSYIKCTMLGGRTAIPTLAGVTHFLETGEILPEDFEDRLAYYRAAAFR